MVQRLSTSTGGSSISSASRRRDIAITACCLAAAVVGDQAADPTVRGQALLRCLGVLGSAYPVGLAPTMAQFRAGLGGPLGKLLPTDVELAGVEDLALLDADGNFSDEARDLCAEHLVPEAAVDGH